MDIKFIETPSPIGNFVNVRLSGKYAYISGQGPFDDNGNLITGKVGKDLTQDEAYDAARRVGITILSVIKNDIGFEKVKKVVKILGLVNCTVDFLTQPKVINGCSDLLVEVFGDRGKHTRVALGMNSLPMNIAVEIDLILEVENN